MSKPAYPYSNAKLLQFIRINAQAGLPYAAAEATLTQLGYTASSIKKQLAGMGYSQAQIKKITTTGPNLLSQLGTAAFLPIPAGLLAGAPAAGETAAGAAGGSATGSAASSLTGTLAKDVTLGAALAFLTSGSNWLRLGEVLAGAVLLLFGLLTLSGGGASGAAKTAVKAARL